MAKKDLIPIEANTPWMQKARGFLSLVALQREVLRLNSETGHGADCVTPGFG